MCSLFTQVPVDCYTVRLLPDDARVKPREGNKGARGTGGSAQSPFIRLIHQFSAAESSRETAADVTGIVIENNPSAARAIDL